MRKQKNGISTVTFIKKFTNNNVQNNTLSDVYIRVDGKKLLLCNVVINLPGKLFTVIKVFKFK